MRPKPDIVEYLKCCANDPMWSDHVEMRKDIVMRAAEEIEALRKQVAELQKDQKELLRI